MMHVRDLQAEDLTVLAGVPAAPMARFLVAAAAVVSEAGDADVLLLEGAGGGFALGAIGYESPFGTARVVAARVRADGSTLRRLLAAVGGRATDRRCVELVGAVDAADDTGRRTFEGLGYVVTGAGVATWVDDPGPDAAPRRADIWWLRRAVDTPERGVRLLPGEDVEPDGAGNPAGDPVALEERAWISD